MLYPIVNTKTQEFGIWFELNPLVNVIMSCTAAASVLMYFHF